MPADWSSFIQNVSDKLASRSIKNNQDLADYLTDQYTNAIIGKAQSIYGNTHQSGRKEILSLALKKTFDELETNPSPTFEEREKDPKFADLKEELPKAPSATDQGLEKEYLAWAEKNPTKAPDFLFFQFFEIGTPYPKTAKEAAPLIARRLVFQFDGSKTFKAWILLLGLGFADDIGRLVVQEYQKLTKGLSDSAIKTLAKQIKLSRKIFQIEYTEDQKEIPSYLTKNFIAKFSYTGNKELSLKTAFNLAGELINDVSGVFSIGEKLNFKVAAYGNSNRGEYKKYIDILQTWSQSIANDAQKEQGKDDDNPKDPYEIMAKGFIDYWMSTLQKPLSPNPPVPPCNLTAPGMGMYIPISYGNRKMLADMLRRAWNSGKTFKIPGTEQIASKAVASALAVCFATHLLQLKFLYNGGISTPGGPAPMLGFIPFVF